MTVPNGQATAAGGYLASVRITDMEPLELIRRSSSLSPATAQGYRCTPIDNFF